MKNNKLIIVIVILVSCVFLVLLNNYMVRDVISENEEFIYIHNNSLIEQSFKVNNRSINKIALFFVTKDTIINGNIHIELYANDELHEKWDIDCKNIKDLSWLNIRLSNSIDNRHSYKLLIRLNCKEDAELGIGVKSKSAIEKLWLNGEISGYELNISYSYWGDKSDAILPIILFFLMIIAMVTYLNIFHKKKENFLYLWIIISIFYSFTILPFNSPDEEHHFYRAYEVSCGHFLSDYNEEMNAGGYIMPLDFDFSKFTTDWSSCMANADAVLSSEKVFKSYSNTALYSPFTYIPQAIGIFIGRCFSNNILLIAMIGRLCNWLVITYLLFSSLKTVNNNEFLLCVLFIPMLISTTVTLSPDGMVIALSIYLITTIIRLNRENTTITLYENIKLFCICILLSQYKIVYLPFVVLLCLLSESLFYFRKKGKMAFLLVCWSVSIGMSYMWLSKCKIFLTHPGSFGTLQVKNVLNHPISYILTVISTYLEKGGVLIYQMFGSRLGQLSIAIPEIVITSYIILFVVVLTKYKIKKADFSQIFILITVLTVFILTSTSLYIQWTPLSANFIDGLQGRYFIPLIFPVFWALVGENQLCDDDSKDNGFVSHRIDSNNLLSNVLVINFLISLFALFSSF